MKTLSIMCHLRDVEDFYSKTTSTGRDSGFDLFAPVEIVVKPNSTVKVDYEISCEVDDFHGYFLMPRSSIYKTPLRLANSVGLIDADYRGHICAVFDNKSSEEYIIKRGDRLVQLVMPDTRPFATNMVSSLSVTERAEGGFGSTGR